MNRLDLTKYNGQGFGVEGNPSQGPFMKCTIFVEKGVITQSILETYQCGVAWRICNTLAEMLAQKDIQEAIRISGDDVMKHTGKIPLGKRFCLNMAISALQKAIASIVGE